MWGLTRYDDNAQINAYKEEFNVTNPCAGSEGGGPAAIDKVIDGQTFYGYPTYCVICPDKKLNFNVCFPPTATCFDPIITHCLPTGITENAAEQLGIFPNPADRWVNISADYQGSVTIEIVDLVGSVRIRDEFSAAGKFNRPVNVENLPPGLYLVAVKHDGMQRTAKLRIR